MTEKIFKGKFFKSGGLKNYVLIVFGSIVMALGYVVFIIPHKIVPGGVYGLSIIIHYVLGFPTGTTALVLNVPLLIWGVKELGPRFGLKTILGLVLTSVFIDLFDYLFPKSFFTSDILMSSVYGGVLIGTGLGLIFKAKATTGGVDIVARIISKHLKNPIGFNLIMIDTVVVITGILVFKNFSLGLYAIITIFLDGKLVDIVLEGIKYNKAVFIISDKASQIKEVILDRVHRGGTIFQGYGMFKNTPKEIIFSALNRREVVMVQEYIKTIDPNAFMVVFDAAKILGEGFGKLEDID